MELKPVYIYAALVVILAAYLFITSSDNRKISSAGNINNQSVPQDNIHKGLVAPGQQTPGKGNVSPDIMQHLEEMKKAMEKNPLDTVKIREYADFLLSAHQLEEALKLYQRLTVMNPKNTEAHFSLAYIFYSKHELNKAEKENDIILSYDRHNVQALYNKGAITASKGDKEKARRIWERVIAGYPSSDAAQLAKAALQKL